MQLTLSKACSARGADMGRRNVLPVDTSKPIKLRLTPLRWVSYDYDQGGAYWGGGSGDSIYCAWDDGSAVNDTGVRIFVRARARQEAKDKVADTLPTAWFTDAGTLVQQWNDGSVNAVGS